jgi:hypothetical protein
VQDTGEAAGGGCLVGHVEVEVDALVVVDRGDQEERGGALGHLFHQLTVTGQLLGQRRHLLGVLEQGLEAVLLRCSAEEVDDALEGGHRCGDGSAYISGTGLGRKWRAAHHAEHDRRLTPPSVADATT